jgi:hypothetical protein
MTGASMKFQEGTEPEKYSSKSSAIAVHQTTEGGAREEGWYENQ